MNKEFNKGLFLAGFGSFWWGFFGVLYFKYITYIGHIELVVHRCLWTTFTLILTTFFFSKWDIFFKEKLNKKRILSIVLVIISILYLVLISIKSLPWVGIIVALSWGFYNLVRKKINIDTDIGLLIESFYILPFALVAFYLITVNGHNDFTLSDPPMMLFIFLAGPMTIIPLFLYVRGVELCGLGATGMIFYITPTFQFLLGYFYYDEPFSLEKLVSFIFIWIAVIIYLKDLYETN